MGYTMSRWISLVITLVLTIVQSPTATTLRPLTAIVVIDETIVDNNMDLPAIFEKAHKHLEIKTDFKTIISSNDSETLDEVCALMETGIIALVDWSSPKLSPLLRSACLTFGIAYISMVDLSYFSYPLHREGTDVAVEPAAVQMLKIIADIALTEKLNNIAIVYDETFDIQNTPRRVLTNVPAQHVYIRLSRNVTQAESHVDTIIKINIKFVFIIASRFNAQSFLAVLFRKKVQNFDPNIFVLTKDARLNCGLCPGSNRILLITARTSVDARSQFIDYMQKSAIVQNFEMDRIKVDEALAFDVARLMSNAVDNLTNEDGHIENIINSDCYNSSATVTDNSTIQSQKLIKAMSEISISGVFGPLSWCCNENTVRYEMTLLVSEMIIEHGTVKSRVQVANWTQTDGIQMTVPSLIKSDMRKKYRVVTVPGIPPFVYKTQPVNGTGEPVYKGYCIELLDLIAKDMEFDYTIYDADQIGSMDEEGKWSGAVRELMDGRADIAVGPISVMAERESVIDFTVPYYDLVGLTILMKKPNFDYSLVKFLTVLDEEVWGCIIGAFVLFSILICIFDKLSPFSYQNRRSQWKGSGAEPRVFTLKEGVWFCMMSLTPQGGGETPRALSGRLIAATWWLFGFIIIATYTANLAAFLTVSRLETPIESLDDLSKQFKVQYAPMNGSIAMIYFERMAHIEHRFYEIWKNMSLNDNLAALERAQLAVWDYPVSDKYTKLWETMRKSQFPPNKSMAVKRVLEEDFAFISDATTNKYETLTNCDLWEVGEEFSRKPYALAVQEGSPLRGELSNAILKLINQRALEELKTTWWKKDEKECPKLEDESDGISIRNIGGVFLVIVIGSALSLITLAFECYWYRFRPEHRKGSTNLNSHRVSSRADLASSMVNNNADEDNTTNTKKEISGIPGLPPGITGHQGLDSGFTNTGFELTERF